MSDLPPNIHDNPQYMHRDTFRLELKRALQVYARTRLTEMDGEWLIVTKASVTAALLNLPDDGAYIAAQTHKDCLYIG